MLNGYKLGIEKLSDQQFSEKYWLNGDAEYQFHTMDIQDGLDERQQLLINNDRALLERDKFYFDAIRERCSDIERKIGAETKRRKRVIAALMLANTAITMALISVIRSLHNR